MYPSIETSVQKIFDADWNITRGIKVPKSEDVVMENGGRLVDATYLYADLAGSSKLAHSVDKVVTATIIRAYINSASRILKELDGSIRSFDGDRVMAVFMGEGKNDMAVRAAFAINWVVAKVIAPAIQSKWPEVSRVYSIDHGVGIDTGEALIVRGGVRIDNDLISIGDAPNDAARLSDYRRYSINISKAVHEDLHDLHRSYGDLKFWTRTMGREALGFNTVTYHSNVEWGL